MLGKVVDQKRVTIMVPDQGKLSRLVGIQVTKVEAQMETKTETKTEMVELAKSARLEVDKVGQLLEGITKSSPPRKRATRPWL